MPGLGKGTAVGPHPFKTLTFNLHLLDASRKSQRLKRCAHPVKEWVALWRSEEKGGFTTRDTEARRKPKTGRPCLGTAALGCRVERRSTKRLTGAPKRTLQFPLCLRVSVVNWSLNSGSP